MLHGKRVQVARDSLALPGDPVWGIKFLLFRSIHLCNALPTCSDIWMCDIRTRGPVLVCMKLLVLLCTSLQLLDQCAGRLAAPSSQGTKFARRLFDANGEEVTDVNSLRSEQELFLSMGEAFKTPYGKLSLMMWSYLCSWCLSTLEWSLISGFTRIWFACCCCCCFLVWCLLSFVRLSRRWHEMFTTDNTLPKVAPQLRRAGSTPRTIAVRVIYNQLNVSILSFNCSSSLRWPNLACYVANWLYQWATQKQIKLCRTYTLTLNSLFLSYLIIVLCLQAHFEQVRGVEMNYPADTPQRQTAVFHQNAAFLETAKSDWEGTIGFPADYQWVSCCETMEPLQRDEILQSKELDVHTHWLVHKEQVKLTCYLCPEWTVT